MEEPIKPSPPFLSEFEWDALVQGISDQQCILFVGPECYSLATDTTQAASLSAYLKEVLPNYDEERVYGSDIKKLIQWYNLLQSKDLLKAEETADEATEDKTKAKKTSAKAKTTPKPKAKAPKVAGNSGAKAAKAAPRGAAKGR